MGWRHVFQKKANLPGVTLGKFLEVSICGKCRRRERTCFLESFYPAGFEICARITTTGKFAKLQRSFLGGNLMSIDLLLLPWGILWEKLQGIESAPPDPSEIPDGLIYGIATLVAVIEMGILWAFFALLKGVL